MTHYVVQWTRSAVVHAETPEEAVGAMAARLDSLGVEHDDLQVIMTTQWPADLYAAEVLP